MIAALNVCGQENHEHQDLNMRKSTVSKTNTKVSQKSGVMSQQITTSIREIIGHYLDLKNYLVADNTKGAATTGKEMLKAMEKLDKSLLTPTQKKVYADIEEDAKEHAEHIGENAGNIEHQREHFIMLSKDIYDLIKAFGSEQRLYKFFCPMANGGKGAIWLSEYKETKNPYFGKKMLTCGSVKEEIK